MSWVHAIMSKTYFTYISLYSCVRKIIILLFLWQFKLLSQELTSSCKYQCRDISRHWYLHDDVSSLREVRMMTLRHDVKKLTSLIWVSNKEEYVLVTSVVWLVKAENTIQCNKLHNTIVLLKLCMMATHQDVTSWRDVMEWRMSFRKRSIDNICNLNNRNKITIETWKNHVYCPTANSILLKWWRFSWFYLSLFNN